MTFPPGRARPATSPFSIGLSKPIPTIGSVPVAFLAANAAGVGDATMASTFRRTSSSARRGSASYRPSATIVDHAVLTLEPPEIAQSLLECPLETGVGGPHTEITYAIDLRCLLLSMGPYGHCHGTTSQRNEIPKPQLTSPATAGQGGYLILPADACSSANKNGAKADIPCRRDES
jgi:hypothetical protein